jgi:poly(3-hydroxybutyrate) depolymerase
LLDLAERADWRCGELVGNQLGASSRTIAGSRRREPSLNSLHSRSGRLRSMVVPHCVLVFALAVTGLAAQAAPKEPGPKSTGKVYEWKSQDGLRYHYYLPKTYDPDAEINLTFILHGSNVDRRWGFANHSAGTFRPDDLVVSPDGTTSNGKGGFNSLQGQADLKRLHALHEELKAAFKVRATYLYGHSQGSFFSFFYAGAYPEDVQGLVGQASGVWMGTRATKKHHHQAVVLMHGTADPVVPYGQSVGGLTFYRDAKYPHVRLRSLDGWNHWPTQLQTEQQLAWCEGMTTSDVTRIAAAFDVLDGAKGVVDPVALYQVAERASKMDGVAAGVVKKATAAMAEIEGCAAKHASLIRKSSGKKTKKLVRKPWIGHLPLFLRHFNGVPACDQLAADWEDAIKAQGKAASKHATSFWKDRDAKPARAFKSGLKLVQDAFLTRASENEEVLGDLEEWAKAGKKLGIGKGDLKLFKTTVPVLREARAKGRKAFDKVGRRFR